MLVRKIMKEFIKENWFRLGILTIVSVFGFYYFFIIIPKEEQREGLKDLELKKNICRELGEEYRKKETEESPNYVFMNYEYIYNKELKTCLYKSGFMSCSPAPCSYSNYVIDLNTNKDVINSYYYDRELIYGLTNEEFEKKAKELFEY